MNETSPKTSLHVSCRSGTIEPQPKHSSTCNEHDKHDAGFDSAHFEAGLQGEAEARQRRRVHPVGLRRRLEGGSSASSALLLTQSFTECRRLRRHAGLQQQTKRKLADKAAALQPFAVLQQSGILRRAAVFHAREEVPSAEHHTAEGQKRQACKYDAEWRCGRYRIGCRIATTVR